MYVHCICTHADYCILWPECIHVTDHIIKNQSLNLWRRISHLLLCVFMILHSGIYCMEYVQNL